MIFSQKTEEKEPLLQAIANSMSLIVDEEQKLLSNFDANMLAFKQHFPNIYQHFLNYEAKNYFVELKDGFANIFDNKNEKYLYDYPPFLEALLSYGLYKRRSSFTKGNLDKDSHHKDKGFLHLKYLNKISEKLEQRSSGVSDDFKALPKAIDSMIIFGVDLGYHLELFLGQHYVSNLYVVEPELDIFYASLFTCNWHYLLELCEKQGINLHLSLGVDKESFFDDFKTQSYLNGCYGVVKTYGYIHRPTAEVKDIIQDFKKRFFELVRGWGFFDDGVMEIAHTLKNLGKNVPILRKRYPDFPDLTDKRAIIVGNGPSLDSHLDTIREMGQSAIVISCGTALSALLKNNIVPDIHVEQERTLPVAEKISFYGNPDVIKDILFFAPNTVHPEVFNLFNRKIMGIKTPEPGSMMILNDSEVGDIVKSVQYVNPTVANTALTIVTELGFKECYFVGVDLGYKIDGNHHSSHSVYYSDDGEDLALFSKEKGNFKVDGNFGGEFHCNGFFNHSRLFLETLITLTPSLNCYNLSDGAAIKGAEPIIPELITPVASFDKQKLLDAIYRDGAYHYQGDELANRIKESASPTQVGHVCHELVEILEQPIDNLRDAVKQLREVSKYIFRLEVKSTLHLSFLLNGSLTYMQAMITNLIHVGHNEQQSMEDYIWARGQVIEFLSTVPSFYADSYLEPNANESPWIRKLRESNKQNA